MKDVFNPTPTLLSKLGSAIVHAAEALGADGHNFDEIAFFEALHDGEVQDWLVEMTKLALIPLRRKQEDRS